MSYWKASFLFLSLAIAVSIADPPAPHGKFLPDKYCCPTGKDCGSCSFQKEDDFDEHDMEVLKKVIARTQHGRHYHPKQIRYIIYELKGEIKKWRIGFALRKLTELDMTAPYSTYLHCTAIWYQYPRVDDFVEPSALCINMP